MKKILISAALIIMLFGTLVAPYHIDTNQITIPKTPDANEDIRNAQSKIFDSNDLMLWYEYEDGNIENPSAPQFKITADDRIVFQHMVENSIWEKVSLNSMPKGSSVNLGNKDGEYFRFWPGEYLVEYVCDSGSVLYNVRYNAPDSTDGTAAPLSEKIFDEFSSLESNAAANIKVKDSGQGHLDIAYQYIIKSINALYGMTKENHSSIKDYQVLSLYITEETDGKFVFYEEKAVKPRYPHTNAYLAGNGYEGDGEWAGYRISTSLSKLELINGYWVCTNLGSGDIHLDD